MKRPRKERAIGALRLVLGGVVLAQSVVFLFSAGSTNAFSRTGLPDAIRVILGCSEITAAALFLLPPTAALGAWALLGVFLGAAVIHLSHGSFEIGSLLVYSTAVIAVMTHLPGRAGTNATGN